MRAELPSLRNRRMQDIMIYMYKVKHGLAPKHISDIFTVIKGHTVLLKKLLLPYTQI